MANGQRRRGVSKYSHLLDEDDTFRAWYRNVLRGSYATGSVYLLRLGRLCELCRVTPRTIASRPSASGPGSTAVERVNVLREEFTQPR
jgi:hypothetical protein